ncbi:terminase small subunit [Edwardsiella tarda]|uniref:Terminase small subunit n=1 Tax=Edwardsiella tarda TaxID=636 RepID=A0A2A7U7K9_EDWTA|nr:terminase small subunit [Edwardsiella tarda]PEH74274.1 hypothetical protein CRM76_01130 [Edwardsiella tarda]
MAKKESAPKIKVTATELANRYGYSVQAVKKWIERGLPFDSNERKYPEKEATEWILKNIIEPLKQVDVREQIDQERLRKERAIASREELKLQEESNRLIPLAYVSTVLSKFVGDIRQTMLQIATVDTIEILEAAGSQKELKEKLREVIDKRLNEVGDIMVNPNLDEFDEYSEDEPEEGITGGAREDVTEENSDFEVV